MTWNLPLWYFNTFITSWQFLEGHWSSCHLNRRSFPKLICSFNSGRLLKSLLEGSEFVFTSCCLQIILGNSLGDYLDLSTIFFSEECLCQIERTQVGTSMVLFPSGVWIYLLWQVHPLWDSILVSYFWGPLLLEKLNSTAYQHWRQDSGSCCRRHCGWRFSHCILKCNLTWVGLCLQGEQRKMFQKYMWKVPLVSLQCKRRYFSFFIWQTNCNSEKKNTKYSCFWYGMTLIINNMV